MYFCPNQLSIDMDFFYDLPQMTQVYVLIAWGIFCVLAVFFWAFRIALKAQREREREWEEDVTINITIEDASDSSHSPTTVPEKQQQPVTPKVPRDYTWKNYLMLLLFILVFGSLIYQLFF